MARKISSPVIFFNFNRPNCTSATFEAIRRIKPTHLFIVIDGPREKNSEDVIKIEKVKSIVNDVNWDCKVYKKFFTNNQGCKRSIVNGLNWVFAKFEYAIILEDDTLPNDDFFYFCDSLLKKYKDNHKIGLVSGNCFIPNKKFKKYSYYFSKIPHMWGWATWRRVWINYDIDLSNLDDDIISKKLRKIIPSFLEYDFYEKKFISCKNKSLDTWDYQFGYMFWKNNFLSIVPKVNLVSNIGMGIDATFTKYDHKLANLKTFKIHSPLIHPRIISYHKCDDINEMRHTRSQHLFIKLKNLFWIKMKLFLRLFRR